MSSSIKILSVVALILLGACTPKDEVINPDNHKVVFEDPIGNTVTSPVSIPYVWNNPITISNHTQDETDKVYTNYLTISGLKDHAVEDKINKAIKDRFTIFTSYGDLKNLPAFRGIHKKIKDGAIVQSINVYVNAAFNANFVLSVFFTLYMSILNPDQSMAYMNLSDGMSFELIHGETLHLSDVFTDDADIATLVNDSLSTTLSKLNGGDQTNYYYGSLSQIKPFTGIHEDQPFYVSEQGLHLMFDYRTPDFETNFSTSMLTIPYYDFLNYIGLTQRFSSPVDIFENPIIDRQFLMVEDDHEALIVEQLTIGSRDLTVRMNYPKELDQSLIDRLLEDKARIKNELEIFSNDHTVDYLSASLSARQIGSYTCLYANYEAYAQVESTYGSDFECYDKHHVLMKIADYFKPGYDYDSALRGAIQDEINKGYLNQDLSLDELIKNMEMRIETTGFFISSTAFSPSGKTTQYLGLSALFSVFGLENLTVFD